ncbi:MAG: sulfoxide reductase heme-binding subunit YedZ [Rhodospirillales bacterium]|nr:sulfoxide reductase heme-binding subunit YedZ [Rhodospirillales bacterium]
MAVDGALNGVPAAEQARPARKTKRDPVTWIVKPVVWVLCLAPLAWLGWLVADTLLFHGRGLTANPVEFINRFLGDWALRFLLIALAVTPVKVLTGWKQAVRLRRLLGLFAFFYVVLHISSYVGLDQFFNWSAIWKDIIKRWYITVGMVAVLCLIPLAVTSTKGWIKRIGGKNWNRLHKAVYIAGAAACLHFIMMRKGLQVEPLIYAGVFAALMLIRTIEPIRRRFRARPAA